VKKRLGAVERLFWIGEQVVSPAVVEDIKPVLHLPDGKTIKEWKAALEEKLHINDTLVQENYVPNKEMLKRIATTIRTQG